MTNAYLSSKVLCVELNYIKKRYNLHPKMIPKHRNIISKM